MFMSYFQQFLHILIVALILAVGLAMLLTSASPVPARETGTEEKKSPDPPKTR